MSEICSKYELDTPCLVLDLDKLDANLTKMQGRAREAGKALRPHAKTHKCSRLAKLQIEAGAIGVCAAKLSEAEALVEAGVSGVLITGPVVGVGKGRRLIALLGRDPGVLVTVDHPEVVRRLAIAAEKAHLVVDVLVDIDPGSFRTGVAPGNALGLGRLVASFASLRLRGVQSYAGHVQHIVGFEKRRSASLAALSEAVTAFRAMRSISADCDIFTGAGTGTHAIDMTIPEVTELQVGSYAVMDADYSRIGCETNAACNDEFDFALTLLTTVVSTNQEEFVTVDAGLKTIYVDNSAPYPVKKELAHLHYSWFGDEYGKLSVSEGGPIPELREVVELVTSHCDPTVNLHDRFWLTRGDAVVGEWPIDLRGRSQ